MKLIVPNSSVICALNTLDCFSHLERLSPMKNWTLIIPNLVMDEVKNNIDASELRKVLTFQTCTVNTEDLKKLRNRFPALAYGELAVLFLVLHYKDLGINADEAIAVLDDKAARSVAKRLGVNYFGTLKLLKNMLDTGILTKPQFYAFIEKLKEAGFRFTDAIIRKIVG